MAAQIPYEQLDRAIVRLVRQLNDFPGVITLGSCAGHEDPQGGGAWPADRWYVTFELAAASPESLVQSPSEEAWLSLEFLTWAINADLARQGSLVQLRPSSPPPYLNEPGTVLRFALEGQRAQEGGIEPDEVAQALGAHLREGRFVSFDDITAELEAWLEEKEKGPRPPETERPAELKP